MWHGPEAAWRKPSLDPAVYGRCEVAFKPGGPSAIHVSTLGNGRAFCFGFGDLGMGTQQGPFPRIGGVQEHGLTVAQVGDGQPTLRVASLTVGGTAA